MTNPMIPGPLRSRLYECRVMHHRLSPKEHRFEYGLFLACVDLDELDAIQQQLRFFSHNRRNLYELRESDHFIHPPAAPEAPASGGLNPDSAVRLSADGADCADEEAKGSDSNPSGAHSAGARRSRFKFQPICVIGHLRIQPPFLGSGSGLDPDAGRLTR
jgi:hypothetical protein